MSVVKYTYKCRCRQHYNYTFVQYDIIGSCTHVLCTFDIANLPLSFLLPMRTRESMMSFHAMDSIIVYLAWKKREKYLKVHIMNSFWSSFLSKSAKTKYVACLIKNKDLSFQKVSRQASEGAGGLIFWVKKSSHKNS